MHKGTRVRQAPIKNWKRMFSADKSPMEVMATFDITVKLGVTLPYVFLVIENLGFDLLTVR
jgi:hypothetical protein